MTSSCHSNEREQREGLRRFAVVITALTVLGYTVLGFGQSPLGPIVGVLSAYATALVLESMSARRHGRESQAAASLLPAHVTGLVIGLLMPTDDRFGAVAIAAVIATASTRVFRVYADDRYTHLFNPANLGITATVLALAWLGQVPPGQLTYHAGTAGAAWVLTAIIVTIGTVLTARYTRRLPLLGAWLAGFMVVALVRALAATPIVDFLQSTTMPTSPVPFVMFVRAAARMAASSGLWEIVAAALTMTTGLAFLVYTFFMVTDPATTPAATRGQVAFGLTVAAVYGTLIAFQVAFALFLSLAIVSAGRGIALAVAERSRRRHDGTEPAFVPVAVADARDDRERNAVSA
jgi:Na+-translocating ferredoxin:NAD+ oxidoreductase RnfD subunit